MGNGESRDLDLSISTCCFVLVLAVWPGVEPSTSLVWGHVGFLSAAHTFVLRNRHCSFPTSFRVATLEDSSVTARAWNGSNGSGFGSEGSPVNGYVFCVSSPLLQKSTAVVPRTVNEERFRHFWFLCQFLKKLARTVPVCSLWLPCNARRNHDVG